MGTLPIRYNLFGELEPIGKPKPQPKQVADAPKPKPSVEVKDIPVKKFRPLTEKELEFYGSLNWEDNPPINGFYETMTLLNNHAAVVVEELNILRERTWRHIDLDRLRLLCSHSWLTTGYEISFGTLDCGATWRNTATSMRNRM